MPPAIKFILSLLLAWAFFILGLSINDAHAQYRNQFHIQQKQQNNNKYPVQPIWIWKTEIMIRNHFTDGSASDWVPMTARVREEGDVTTQPTIPVVR